MALASRGYEASAIALALVVSPIASAQGVSDAQAIVDETAPKTLDTVTVTAEKRGEQSIMDTAFSISAYTGEQLEEQGVDSLLDVLNQTPGVSTGDFLGTRSFIQIRGTAATVGDSAVGYYLDDLPYTMLGLTIAPDLNPYDLERVEVLRGPQGTLYGASSLGGTVRVLTATPEHNEFTAKVTAGYASTDGGGSSHKLQGAMNIPLIEDKLSARVVVSSVEKGGYIDLPLTGETNNNDATDESYRVKLRVTPNENLDIVLSTWHFEEDAGLNFAEDNFEFSPIFGVFDAFDGPPTGVPVGVQPVTGSELRNTSEIDLQNLRVSWDFGDFNFFSGTSFLEVEEAQDVNFFGTPFAIPFTGETFSQEFRLSRSGEAHSWTIGSLYLDAENNQLNLVSTIFEQTSLDTLNAILAGAMQPTLSNPFEILAADATSTSEQFALFGELKFDLSDRLSVTGGLRYYTDDRTSSEDAPLIVDGLTALGISNATSTTFEKTTGRINLSYEPNADALYYINIAQGFRPGTPNPADARINSFVDPTLDFPDFTNSETLTSYEIGSKKTLLDGRLAIEAAIYYMDWEDFIASVTTPNALGNPVSSRLNANDVSAVGFDYGVLFQATDNLLLNVSGNFNKTEYDSDVAGAGTSEGDQLSLVPETTLNASATYSWDVSNDFEGLFRIGYNYTSERSDYLPGLAYTSDDIGVVGARLAIESERWSLAVTGENLTNEDSEAFQIGPLIGAGVPAVRLRPLTVGIEATLKFGG